MPDAESLCAPTSRAPGAHHALGLWLVLLYTLPTRVEVPAFSELILGYLHYTSLHVLHLPLYLLCTGRLKHNFRSGQHGRACTFFANTTPDLWDKKTTLASKDLNLTAFMSTKSTFEKWKPLMELKPHNTVVSYLFYI